MARISGAQPQGSAPPHPDLVIADLADRQHGVVTRRQLLAAGVSDDAIRHRIAVNRLRRAHLGVYELGGPRRTQEAVFMAAVLASGDRAVLSHRSAAAHWNLRPQRSGPVEVTVPRRGTSRRAGVRIHTTRSLMSEERTVHDGVPCTSVARTLVDLAGLLDAPALRRALERAQHERLFDCQTIDHALARARGRGGTTTLSVLLAELADHPPPVRSEFEHRFLDVIRVDRGKRTHATASGFRRDRERDYASSSPAGTSSASPGAS